MTSEAGRLRGLFTLWVTIAALVIVIPASAAANPAPLSQLGSAGSNAGQLSNPSGVAVDGSGNVFVSDQSNARISEFNPSGGFVRAFGWGVLNGSSSFQVCTTICQAGLPGGGAGQLNLPGGLAFDASGRLFVADRNNRRISVFDTGTPAFVRAFGWDVADPDGNAAFEVCPTQGACRAGDSGGGAGQLTDPIDIAFDAAGNLFVSDSLNNRISQFNATPSFTRAFGWGVLNGSSSFQVCTTSCQAGDPGSGAGQLNSPRGLALDGAGNLFVVDGQNQRLDEFNSNTPAFSQAVGWGVLNGTSSAQSCTNACMIGLQGGGSGQFQFPNGVVLDGQGSLYVADTINERIAKYAAPALSFTLAFGKHVNGGAGFDICTNACQTGSIGNGSGELDFPELLTADCRGAIWVPDSGNNRVQRFGEPGTALPPCSVPAPPSNPSTPPTTPAAAGPTGQRAAALKKCKKKHGRARSKCKKKANLLPL